MNLELQERFEEHSPLMIYPFGVGDSTGPRVIAEGFVYAEGVFFFDVGWNNPMAGTGTDHFVEGRIEGPFPDLEENMYWKVGESATIHDIPEGSPRRRSSFDREFAVAKENIRLVERFKDDEYKNRARAKAVADKFVRDSLECHRDRNE
ncbi:MAG: hypothetical protein L3J49_06900 [Desulfobulbaceae bacterium]|nr:hypothetical protein [Desulfobulbaceae bacterium]